MVDILFVLFGPAIVLVASGIMYGICVSLMSAYLNLFDR